MSNDVAIQQKANTLQNLLEKHKSQFEMALPKHLSVDRLLRIALTEARKNPRLLECTTASFLGAIIQTAQLGLEPGNQLGHAYLVPFKNKKLNITEVQLIVGYRGMIDLAYRSPLVDHVVARPVYDTDKFSYEFGLSENLSHTPDPLGAGTKLTHVYFIVFLKSGGKLFDVMTLREVEIARARSKSPNDGPWVDDFEAMALKSIVRKFSKYTPISIELQQAAQFDDAGDRGEQNNASVVETITGTVSAPQASKQSTNADKFKAQLSAENEEAPTFEHRDEGSYGGFRAGVVEAKPAVIIEEPEQPKRTKEELVGDVISAAASIDLSMPKLAAKCKKQFNKTPADLEVEQLEWLLAELQHEKKERK